jgi:NitT/TauT family transport system ATP-binding protein
VDEAVLAPGLQVREIVKRFARSDGEVTVVDDCSFSVPHGTLTVMLGPSGCGKTTLVNLIAGYEMPSLGEILLDGNPVRAPGADRIVVFQESALFPWMTVLDNVTFGPQSRRGRIDAAMRQRARVLLADVGLEEFAHRYPSQLSGGMQRRAELARAIVNEPALMLLDEPFRGLDAMTRELMQEQYLRLFEADARTTLFVTSELREAIFLADRLLIMTPRPARVRRTIEVDLPRPRQLAMLASARFREIYEETLLALEESAWPTAVVS